MGQPGDVVLTIGILGGGQLGKMSALAARKLGYRTKVFDPNPSACALAIADEAAAAEWNDLSALEKFAQGCARTTLEFENIPPSSIDHVNAMATCYPSASVLETCQNRQKEKTFLKANHIPCAPFLIITTLEELVNGVKILGYPCVLKTAQFGYDGKGQIKITSPTQDLEKVWLKTGGGKGVLESWISHECEISVIIARNERGEVAIYEPTENIHHNHILHLTLSPARITQELAEEAKKLASIIAQKINLVGILAVEMFVVQGKILVNELAPRPHNSGHVTLDNNETSQFEQHIRAVCGLSLGGTQTHTPAVMVNILGDLWKNGQIPGWEKILKHPNAKLHLYEKGDAAPGRKMGHFTVLGPNLEEAFKLAQNIDRDLRS